LRQLPQSIGVLGIDRVGCNAVAGALRGRRLDDRSLVAILEVAASDPPMWRERFVVSTAPGWTAFAVMPSPLQRRFAPTAKRTFAVLDWPYATSGSYGRDLKLMSSKTTGERK
jgi:hypothetical protein